jgi:hypothetical protein
MSYLILKKIKPNTGKKKKSPKIKLSFVYKFFFFKKHPPGQLPAQTSIRSRHLAGFSKKSNGRFERAIRSTLNPKVKTSVRPSRFTQRLSTGRIH